MGNVAEGALRSTVKVRSSTIFRPESWASLGVPACCRSSYPLMLEKSMDPACPLAGLAAQDQALVKEEDLTGLPSEKDRPSTNLIV